MCNVDLSAYSNGVYFFSLYENDLPIVTKKILK